MATILFMLFFGRWGKSEMQWHGNDYVRGRIKKRETKWVGMMVIIDLCGFALLFLFRIIAIN